jgi:hypothetical protein
MRKDDAMSRARQDDAPRAAKDPGALIGSAALIVGVLWILGCAVTAYVLLGQQRLFTLAPVELAALAAGAILPAIMVWFSGMAAGEGARARSEARRLADAADRLMSPAKSAEDGAKKLALSVRAEITTLDHALEKTLARLQEVEGMIARQAQSVDQMSGQAKAGADQMITGMEREREELMKISRDLTGQAQMIGDSISKHTRVISEAAKMAEQEVRAADQALDTRLTSFGAAAALITDRTHALSNAAQGSADSALRLETALSNALDVLAKATNLTDAARQSADAAAVAANSTAGAVRESTSRAIEDAKRAADVIRGEAANVEREAAVALERLRDAAEGARAAAVGARAAVEEIPRNARPAARAPDMRRDPDYRAPEPPAPTRRDEPRRDRDARRGESLFGEPASGPPSASWTWRELLGGVEEDAPSEPQRSAPAPRRAPAEDAVARLTHAISEPRGHAPALPAADMIEAAGLRLPEVFSGSGLERIAQRARSGTQARRRAVKDAAPDAVRRLADHLARDAHANQEAMQFLRSDGARIAELLARGRAAMNADATRAFLLIDSAAG